MQKIKCPNCGEVFVVDESGYAQIVKQVRDQEFDRELRQREKELEDLKEKDLELAQIKQKEAFDKVDLGKGNIPQDELLSKRLPEMPAQLVPVIEEIWLEEVVGK